MPSDRKATSRRDFTQVALDVVKRATGETAAPVLSDKQKSGRKGGIKGGASRAITMTREQRSEIARVAAQARWKKA